MAFSTLYLLTSVVATLLSAYTGRLDRLAIHYPGAWLRVSFHAHPLTQSSVHPFPCYVQPPLPKVVIDGAPWWEVVWQQSPSTAAPNDVEDSVEDLAQGVHPRTT